MKLIISSNPHQKDRLNTSRAMYEVALALVPAVIAAFYFFRLPALSVILICIITCLLGERAMNYLRRQPSTITDGSALVTGLLLALSLPPATKWYAAVLGSLFAIIVGKHIFGGLGSNIFNPALIGRAFLAAAYPKMLTTWSSPFGTDAVTSATPLALLKFDRQITAIWPLVKGNIGGCLGETSAICLIIGGLYLLIRKIADWRIPLAMVLTVTIISGVFYIVNPVNGSPFFHLFSGGLILGLFFMVTDPVTTPFTKSGRYIFGIGCGLLVMVIRYFSGLPEGVMYAILFMNAVTPLINRYTQPLAFGRK